MEALSERFEKRIDEIVARYPDYHRDIYRHTFRALENAGRRVSDAAVRSISVTDFVKGDVVSLAVKEWGILAFSVFCFWGVATGADLKNVLQRLVRFKVFKQDVGERLEQLNAIDLKEIFIEWLKNR